VKFEIVTEVPIKFTVGCGVMPYSLVEVRRYFRSSAVSVTTEDEID
jgi:hypothetical protein